MYYIFYISPCQYCFRCCRCNTVVWSMSLSCKLGGSGIYRRLHPWYVSIAEAAGEAQLHVSMPLLHVYFSFESPEEDAAQLQSKLTASLPPPCLGSSLIIIALLTIFPCSIHDNILSFSQLSFVKLFPIIILHCKYTRIKGGDFNWLGISH